MTNESGDPGVVVGGDAQGPSQREGGMNAGQALQSKQCVGQASKQGGRSDCRRGEKLTAEK